MGAWLVHPSISHPVNVACSLCFGSVFCAVVEASAEQRSFGLAPGRAISRTGELWASSWKSYIWKPVNLWCLIFSCVKLIHTHSPFPSFPPFVIPFPPSFLPSLPPPPPLASPSLLLPLPLLTAVLAMERLGSDGEDGAAKARRQQKRTERPNRETKKQQ